MKSKSHSEAIGCIQGCVGSPPSYKTYTSDFNSGTQDSILIKWADDSTNQAIADNWHDCETNLNSASDHLQSLSHANRLSLDPKKSETIPIISNFSKLIPGLKYKPGKMEILGIVLDLELTFKLVINRIKAKLGRTFDILIFFRF